MEVKKYKPGVQLTPHFNSSEFACKCCGKIYIDPALSKLMEKLIDELNLSKVNVISGYRCATHDKAVGGAGSGSHVMGYAGDFRCYYKDGSVVPSSVVALTLERMGHKCGIGYRCGRVPDSSGNIHIDVRPRKWWSNEATNASVSSFFTYLAPFPVTVVSENGLNIRKGDGTGYAVVGAYACGDIVTVTGVNSSHTWGKTNLGWICIKSAYVRFGRK